jgi:hypothetical protein
MLSSPRRDWPGNGDKALFDLLAHLFPFDPEGLKAGLLFLVLAAE